MSQRCFGRSVETLSAPNCHGGLLCDQEHAFSARPRHAAATSANPGQLCLPLPLPLFYGLV